MDALSAQYCQLSCSMFVFPEVQVLHCRAGSGMRALATEFETLEIVTSNTWMDVEIA
jgi:hypothetical protein